jgi:T-complex protein 1 subunit gamma
MAEPWLEKNMHPRTIIQGYTKALDDALAHMKSIAIPVDVTKREDLLNVVRKCLGTKFVTGFFPPSMSELALDAVSLVYSEGDAGRKEADIKRFIKVEKVWLP